MRPIWDLHAEIVAQGIPIIGVGFVDSTVFPLVVRIDFDPAATSEQRTQAQAIAATFDWSDEAQVVWENLQQRKMAKVGFATETTDRAKAWRAIVSLLLDENNALRSWVMSFKAAVAAASNFADLKTRIAALPNLPDRTLAQAKAAFAAKIDGGTVD